MEPYVELKYLLKCMPVIVLTLRSKNYFKFFNEIFFTNRFFFHFFMLLFHTQNYFNRYQVESLQKAFHICEK